MKETNPQPIPRSLSRRNTRVRFCRTWRLRRGEKCGGAERRLENGVIKRGAIMKRIIPLGRRNNSPSGTPWGWPFEEPEIRLQTSFLTR